MKTIPLRLITAIALIIGTVYAVSVILTRETVMLILILTGFGVLKFIIRTTKATLTVSCVDNVKTRFDIAEILTELKENRYAYSHTPTYWLDFGNSRSSGQVILSTVGNVHQPQSEKYTVIGNLPFVTEEFGELLTQSEQSDDTPSCSLADALEKQDLFINSTLAQMGCSLLWNLFRNGLTDTRGFFLNLKDFRTQPLKIG